MGWLDKATKEDCEAVTLDDLPSASRVIARLLRRIGFSVVHECDSAEQAFRVINNHPKVRVLICDSALPDNEAYALLARLALHQSSQSLVIILTTELNPLDQKKATWRGITLRLLKKPFTDIDLRLHLETSYAHQYPAQ